MRVSKQKMPAGQAASDTPSMYAIRDAISAERKTVNIPILSTYSAALATAPVTMRRAPWDDAQ